MITHTPVRKLGLGTIQRAEPRSETRPRRELTAAESALVLLLPSSTPLRACLLVRRRLPRHVPTVVARATASNAAQALRMSTRKYKLLARLVGRAFSPPSRAFRCNPRPLIRRVLCVRVAHRRHQLSLFTACAGIKACSRLSVRSTELELCRSYSAQQTISTCLCTGKSFVKQQAPHDRIHSKRACER